MTLVLVFLAFLFGVIPITFQMLTMPVSIYADCMGMSRVPYDSAALDTCWTGEYYFVGHNPGIFTPIQRLRRGDIVGFNDGKKSHYFIVDSSEVRTTTEWFPAPDGINARMQTCLSWPTVLIVNLRSWRD